MIKLTAQHMKKVQIPGVEYSSQSFSAGIEHAQEDNLTEEQAKDRLKKLFALVEESVDEQIVAALGQAAQTAAEPTRPAPADAPPPTEPRPTQEEPQGGGHGEEEVSDKQVKMIYAVGMKVYGPDWKITVQKQMAGHYSNNRTRDTRQLTKKEASTLISFLKEKEDGTGKDDLQY